MAKTPTATGPAMSGEPFLAVVEQAAGLDHDAAERAVRATLETLAEKLTREQARDLVVQLPPEIGAWLHTDGHPQRLSAEDFVRRTAQREGVDERTAERHARVVLQALARAVSQQEYDDVVATLSRDFATLLPRGPAVEEFPADRFLERVAAQVGGPVGDARRAADAVLETLGERIAAGQVEDLALRLDRSLREPLLRGSATGGGQAHRVPLDRFVARVAQREGVDDLLAREHIRAVLGVLREAVGDEEFFDTVSQLPPDYDVLWLRPEA